MDEDKSGTSLYSILATSVVVLIFIVLVYLIFIRGDSDLLGPLGEMFAF